MVKTDKSALVDWFENHSKDLTVLIKAYDGVEDENERKEYMGKWYAEFAEMLTGPVLAYLLNVNRMKNIALCGTSQIAIKLLDYLTANGFHVPCLVDETKAGVR